MPERESMAIGATLAAVTAAEPLSVRQAPARLRTTSVANEKQLRKAVVRANRRDGTDRIRLTSDIRFKKNKRVAGRGARAGDLDVTDDLVVIGGANTINARRRDRIFDAVDGTRLTLRNLTLKKGAPAKGQSGGAVRGSGAGLLLVDVYITKSRVVGEGAKGGAVATTGGALTVRDSRLVDNRASHAGGAISVSSSDARLSSTFMRANAAGYGGAVHSVGAGTTTIKKGLIRDNTATARGGALFNSAEATMRVIKVRVRRNEATGGAAGGGGGLANDGGDLLVRDSQLRSNAASGAGGSGGGILNDGGDLRVIDTEIAGGSAATAGGAVETIAGTSVVIRSQLTGNTAGSSGVDGAGGAIHLTGAGDAEIRESVVRDNVAQGTFGAGGGLWNSAAGVVTVVGSTFEGNEADGFGIRVGGAAMYDDGGTLAVRDSVLHDNETGGLGGAILTNGGVLDIARSVLSSNIGAYGGGGVASNFASVTIQESTLRGNVAFDPVGGDGGGLVAAGGSVDISDSQIAGNEASNGGGGIYKYGPGTMVVVNTRVEDNVAGGYRGSTDGGGGLYQRNGTLTVTDSTFMGNRATGWSGSGGGIANDDGTLIVSGTTLSHNDAVVAGGGIETRGGEVSLRDVDLDTNTAQGDPGVGGGFYMQGPAVVDYTGGSVAYNVAAAEGGGLWCSNAGSFVAADLTFYDNVAGVAGDDVYHQDPDSPPGTSICIVNGTSVAPGR